MYRIGSEYRKERIVSDRRIGSEVSYRIERSKDLDRQSGFHILEYKFIEDQTQPEFG